MAIELEVDVSDLLKWSRLMGRVPRRTKPAIARAINTFGDNVARNAAHYMAEMSGLPESEIMGMIEIKKATPNDLEWSMDTSQIIPPSMDWSRPWEARSAKDFDKNALVKVVTVGDAEVCEICQEAAERSPYTMEEVYSIRTDMRGAEGLIHQNCRCMLQAWQATRMMPIRMGAGAPKELFSTRQLGEAIAGELEVVLRMTEGS